MHTVRSHLQRLYSSHGMSNRAEAVAAWVARAQGAALQPEVEEPSFEERLSAAAQTSAAARLPVQVVEAPAQLELVNHERALAGLAPLDWDDALAGVALQGARQMAGQGHLSTVIGVIDQGAVTAENVGYWSGINDHQLHTLFAADPKQRANVLGPHRALGAAWATTGSGVAFLSVVFA